MPFYYAVSIITKDSETKSICANTFYINYTTNVYPTVSSFASFSRIAVAFIQQTAETDTAIIKTVLNIKTKVNIKETVAFILSLIQNIIYYNTITNRNAIQ